MPEIVNLIPVIQQVMDNIVQLSQLYADIQVFVADPNNETAETMVNTFNEYEKDIPRLIESLRVSITSVIKSASGQEEQLTVLADSRGLKII